jgi:3D (Asp-Asp-Asp) domain-containing protein
MKHLAIPLLIIIFFLGLPKIELKAPQVPLHQQYEIKEAIFTAYTLSEDETDSTPNIGAWGDDLSRRGSSCVVATRLYPRATEIIIKGIAGRCKVLDKTSKKFSERIDILFPNKKSAKKFGIKTLEYYVIK